MSHTVKINTKFKQISPFRSALSALGWSFKEKAKIRTYPGDPQGKELYDFVAVNPQTTHNAYDIGIMEQNGELGIFMDPYGGSIYGQLGNELTKLKAEYAYRCIEEKYAQEGASVFRTVNQDGTMDVTVEMQ